MNIFLKTSWPFGPSWAGRSMFKNPQGMSLAGNAATAAADSAATAAAFAAAAAAAATTIQD